MDETQKNSGEYLLDKIERFLKEGKRTKRDLAKSLGIKENSINRTLKNSNISLSKLGTIADFFGVDIIDLLQTKEVNAIQDMDGGYQRTLSANAEATINNLNERLERKDKTIDQLVQFITENFPDRKNSTENIQ